MTGRSGVVGLGVLGLLGALAAAGRPAVAAEDDAPPSIATVKEAMRGFVASGEVAGVVTLVRQGGRVVHLDATGEADLAAHRPMRSDSVFWIASMSKPITAAAVLMLQDEGKLSIDDPVDRFLPEFKGLKSADGRAARVTIGQLLTHTSGLAEDYSDAARRATTLAEVVPLFARQPLTFDPGSRWVYCQSGINTAARVVEVVSGRSFPDFLEARLFRPLGMTDTTFYLTDAQAARLATSYRKPAGGPLAPTEIRFLNGTAPTSRDRFPAGNGGLFSTAPDYGRFCQMLLDGGTFGGRRYLSEKAVGLMSTVRTGDLKTGFTPGNGWGVGCCVVRAPQGASAALSPGSFGHGGAYGTQAWIDPKLKRAYVLMVQRADFPNSDDSPVRKGFQQAAAEALEGASAKGPESVDVFIERTGGYFAYRIPAIETTPDGTLLAFAEARKYTLDDPGDAQQDIDLVYRRSRDGGRTWSTMTVIEDPGELWSAANPATVVDRSNGRVWLLYVRCKPGRSTTAARPGTDDAQVLARTSDDNGRSWSDPIDLTAAARDMADPKWGMTVPGPGGMVQDRQGRLIAACWKYAPYANFVLFSDDHGKTWKRGGLVPGAGDEDQLVELADGRLLIDVRQQDKGPHRWFATSADGGLTWTDRRPGNPVSAVCCAIERYTARSRGDDRDRIVWTGPKGPDRRDLVARLSYDEGRTFPVERSIGPGFAAYSDLTVTADGTLGVLWERGADHGYQFITFTRVPRAVLEPTAP